MNGIKNRLDRRYNESPVCKMNVPRVTKNSGKQAFVQAAQLSLPLKVSPRRAKEPKTTTHKPVETHRRIKSRLLFQDNTTLLPNVNTIALGMFCGAKYTHHTFTSIIKDN